MNILLTSGWDNYQLIDSGDGYRLEKFGPFILSRPDPQIIWQRKLPMNIWQQADAMFERTIEDRGRWVKKNPKLPDSWHMKYKDLTFVIKLSPFKHTGVFPEQHLQWDFITECISSRIRSNNKKGVILGSNATPESLRNPGLRLNRSGQARTTENNSNQPNILNLFAYTGIASLAAASAGAKVTHVDASRPTIGWARENQTASKLSEKPIRWILDDAVKFVEREIKRGVQYDGIILDPPVFGHGPDGRMWKFNEDFPKLMSMCKQVLSPTPLFVLVNAYAISSSSLMLENVLQDYLGDLGGTIEVGELVLEEKQNKRLLSTSIFARWSR